MSTSLHARWGEPSIGSDPHLLAGFAARPTDVIINTAPKAGTTWMQQILHQLRSGGDPDFGSIYEVVPWLEFPGRRGSTTDDRLKKYESIADPRLFKSHLRRTYTPGLDVARFIVVARDPRDCCISGFYHLRDMTPQMKDWLQFEEPESFDAYFEQWMESGWFQHVKSWWPHCNDHNVLWTRYEDMKLDLRSCMEQIVQFLSWEITEAVFERATTLSSFQWMAENRDKFTRFSSAEEPSWKPGAFIRKGRVGDHKSLLSAKQQDRILSKAKSELGPDCFTFFRLS